MASAQRRGKVAVGIRCRAGCHEVGSDYGLSHMIVCRFRNAVCGTFQAADVLYPCTIGVHVAVVVGIVVEACSVRFQNIASARNVLCATRQEMREGFEVGYCLLIVGIVDGAYEEMLQYVVQVVRVNLSSQLAVCQVGTVKFYQILDSRNEACAAQ